MSEFDIGTLAVFGLIGLSVSAFFYQWGGRSRKWIRRWIGALVFALTVILMSLKMGKFSYYQLLIIPMLIGSYHLGYGGTDNLLSKIIRRSIYAIAVCSSGVIMALTIGGSAWALLIVHYGVGLWSIYLGVRNPIQAAGEEVLICALLNIVLLFYPFC